MIVRAVNELEYAIDSMSREKRYSIDVECVDRGFPDITLVGISVGWSHKDGAYIPVGHAKGAQLPTDLVLERLKKFIEGNPNKIAVMHNCLNYYTPIWLADGSKMNIGEIVKKKLAVEVMTWDFETQKIVPKKVVNWFENGRKENWYRLSFRDGRVLYVTGDHEVYIKGNESNKVPVSALSIGDKMMYGEYELTEEQLQVVLGTVLGDASLIKDSEHSHVRLSVGHCAEQRFYTEWKYKALSSICNSGVKEVVNDKGFSKEGGKLYRIQTKNTVQLDSIYDELYKEGTKRITNRYLEKMDGLALATWFMDDGSKSGRQLTLHCYSYAEEDVDTIVSWFDSRWKIKARKQKRENGFNLVFTGDSRTKLIDVIQPYVLEGFSYKLGVTGTGSDIGTPKSLRDEDIVDIEYLGKMKKPYGSIGYDIEVEDTHNYFANGLLVSNSKYDMTVLDLLGGIKFSENIFDTMVASWLLDTENPHGLKPLAKRYLNYAMTELDEITPKERHPVTNDWVYRTDLVDIETMSKYAMDDVTKPLQLMDIFLPRLEAEGQLKIFAELEMPKVFILKDIEMNGIRLDVETLKKRMEEAPKVLEEIKKRMYALRPNGKPFNASSTKQLNQVLFDEVKIKPIGEPGKTGLYSTSKDIMEQWAGKYPIVDAILEYRQVSKLMGTYLEGLTKRIGPDGRIRTRFNPILTTGRLSSSRPNLNYWVICQ